MRKSRLWLLVLLVVVGLRGVLWADLVPPMQGPDEPVHFSTIYNYLVELDPFEQNRKSYDQRTFLLREKTQADRMQFRRWGRRDFPEGTYYGPDEEKLRDLPLDLGKAKHGYPFLSTNTHPYFYYVVASYWLKLFPTSDPLSQLFWARIFSAVLGVISVWFVYLASRKVFGDREIWTICVTSFFACIPMFNYVSSIVNLDAWCYPIVAFYYYAIVSWLSEPDKFKNQLVAALSMVFMVSTKLNAYLLFCVAFIGWGTLIVQDWRQGIKQGLWLIIPSIVLTTFYFSYEGYSENLVQSQKALEAYGLKYKPKTWAKMPIGYLTWSILWKELDSYWGAFGWHDTKFPKPIYWCFSALMYFSFFWVGIRTATRRFCSKEDRILATVSIGALCFLFLVVAVNLQAFHNTGNFYGLGRQLFGLWFPASICMIYGLGRELGEKYREMYGKVLAAAMIGLNFAGCFVLLIPRYYL